MLAPTSSSAITRSQPGAKASVTVTSLKATLPELATAIVNCAAEPATTCWLAGLLLTDRAGLCTDVVSVSLLLPATGSVSTPATTTLLVNVSGAAASTL